MPRKAALLITLCLLASVGFGSAQAVRVHAQDQETPPLPDPVLGALDLDAVAQIDLTTYPIVPEISERAKQIYLDASPAGIIHIRLLRLGTA